MKKMISIIVAITIFTVSILTVRAAVLGNNEEKITSDAPLNSWRYSEGVPDNAQPDTFASVGASKTAWTKTDKGFVDSNGKIIKGATMKGIDVSQWNGKIDWKKVKKTDVDYAIIRIGYGDDYKSQDDTQFVNNVKGCIENKIPFGVYIYSYAKNTSMALSEAKHTLRLIKGYTINFPVYYDLEDDSQTKLGSAKLGAIAKTYCNEITKAGYQVGIYANLNWWTNYLKDPAFNNTKWFKWVAQYNSECTYKSPYTMWQCCSDGKVDGISGYTDINFWYDEVRTSSTKAFLKGVYLNTTNKVIYRDKSYGTATLKATVITKSKEKGVKWKSSDEKIAKVDSKGKITAKKVGTCKITATAKDGSKNKATCVVEVRRRMDSFKLNKSKITLNKTGKTYILTGTCKPKSTTVKTFKWITTNEKVATVNSKGKVKAVGNGICYICATSKDGSNRTEVCRVTVKIK